MRSTTAGPTSGPALLRAAFAAAALMCAMLNTGPAAAQMRPGKLDPDSLDMDKVRAMLPEYFHPEGTGRTKAADIPDVFGPGAVLTAGNLFMKVTNFGHCGNFFTNLSSDPAGQWPGASGVEYLSTIRLAVAGKNPQATDPTAIRRVSYLFEWRPPTLDPVDHIYHAYDGIINGQRFLDDDGDAAKYAGDPTQQLAHIDEDFLDGHDNDGDGLIDEDYAALGQSMYSCVMRDDTPEAINATFNEKHVPLGLECRQLAWCYSIPGFEDFDVIQYTIFNRSGHTLDSLCIGWLVDIDVGPTSDPNFFRNDFDLPQYPHGEFTIATLPTDKRMQDSSMRDVSDPTDPPPSQVPRDSALCPRYKMRINGFSQAQAPGALIVAPGVSTFLLVNHTIDPLGISGPSRVGFTSFRSFTAGTPYNQGGNPIVDQQRYEMMVGTQPNGLGDDGFINATNGDQKGDYVEWCSTGPFRNLPDGGRLEATVALAVQPGTYNLGLAYENDYERYLGGGLSGASLIAKYPSLDNAIAVQIAYDGVWEERPQWPLLTNGHGRETPLIAAKGSGGFAATPDCHDQTIRFVTETAYDWFDYDCDYCTGAYDSKKKLGMFHHTWNTDAPPPNPNTNMSVSYNYSDNPDRKFPPIGDHQILLAWDNLSEVTPNPRTGVYGFRGYKLWKVAGWQRPVGSSGPSDDDWQLLGEFDFFNYLGPDNNYLPNNMVMDSVTHTLHCPMVFVPNYYAPDTGYVGPRVVPICLTRGDIWDHQDGLVLHPDNGLSIVDSTHACSPFTAVDCSRTETRYRYPVGRYRFVDKEVKNGFLYFYSVTAFDSSFTGLELNGRRSTSEAEGVSPQISTRTGKSVWVVPNPYRGYRDINRRPSAWDLTPNATDPTGTHIDFFGLPRGDWTIKIYTVAGDNVAVIKNTDPVNDSLRAPIANKNGKTYPGTNQQQDNPNDGQARWNLISRNGQDVVSGIYLFTVSSSQGIQRGKFVIIR